MTMPEVSPKTELQDLGIEVSLEPSRMNSIDHTSTKREVRSKSDYDFTNSEDVRSYLEDYRGLKDFQLHSLSGGTANHVYRLIGKGVDAGKTWVFKHAAQHLASNQSFSLPPIRMDFEAKFLANKLKDETECHCTAEEVSSVADISIERTHAQTVPLIFYEGDTKLLCIQDAGNRNLKDAYTTLSQDVVQEIGTEIGKWLARLHGETPFSSVTGPSNFNNKVGEQIARYTYMNLAETFQRTGHDVELGEIINERFGSLIANDRESVCHGDFWPGNVMLQSNSPTGAPYIVTVIDWEMVRVGNSATDVGQFAAEAFLLDRFHGGKGLHAAFIKAYFQSSAIRFGIKEWLYPWMTRVAVHFGAHLAFWPSRSVHWANREDTKALVDMAVAILRDASSSTPNALVWRVFEGVPGLDEIAQEMTAKRGMSEPDPESRKRPQS